MLTELITYARGGNAVKRFHTTNLLVPETVGHHSAGVAYLCYLINPGGAMPRPELLLAALTHDHVEQHTGDIPAPAKWAHPALAHALESAEKDYETHNWGLASEEQRVLKQADMLDLVLKCQEEVMMYNFRSVEPILHRGIQWLYDNDPLPAVVQILQEMGYHGSK